MGYLGDSFGWGFGFGAGVAATESAFNAVENTYRAKSFDPVVRQDLMDILLNHIMKLQVLIELSHLTFKHFI